MHIKVYKNTKESENKGIEDWPSNAKYVFSVECYSVRSALNLIKTSNEGDLKKLDVSDGDFLAAEDGVPYIVSDNCSVVKRFNGKKLEVTSYGQ